MLEAFVIDDEPLGIETLGNLIRKYCPGVYISQTASQIERAIQLLEAHQPDLVFLDIEMQTGTGFDILQQVKSRNFEVIFTTAYNQYAIQAIRFSAMDYLLKPIQYGELQAAVKRVEEKRSKNHLNEKLESLLSNVNRNQEEPMVLTLVTTESYSFVATSDILYCEADGAYTHFFLKNDRSLFVSKHLKEYENLLTGHPFFRVHQSYLINVKEVEKYVRTDGGYLLMKNGKRLPVSRGRKEAFLKLMTTHRI